MNFFVGGFTRIDGYTQGLRKGYEIYVETGEEGVSISLKDDNTEKMKVYQNDGIVKEINITYGKGDFD